MPRGSLSLVMLLTLAGCIIPGDPTETSTAAGPSTGGTTGGATDGAPTTEGAPTTGEVAGECNLWEQDCAPGSKCAPYDSMSQGLVDSTRCVAVAESAKQSGDLCEAEGGVVGLDDCDHGLLCWFLDGEGQGVCTPLCTGTPGNGICGDGLVCDISNGGLLPLCLATCDPLAPACPMNQICIPSASMVFVCDGDVSGDGGFFGDPCEFINVCNPGLLCVAGPNVPGCDTQGCCTSYCDLTKGPEQCAPEQQCVPYFEADPPPGYENVGLCAIKQ